MRSQHTVYLLLQVFSTKQFSFLTKKILFALSSELGQVYIYCQWFILVWNHECLVEFLFFSEIWLC